MKTRISLLLALLSLPAMAAEPDWGVYQQGSALELSMDRNSIWVEKDGLVHFVNQERFSERQYDKATDIKYFIRRTSGYASCSKQQYTFVGFEYADKRGRQLYSTMFRYNALPGNGSRWNRARLPTPCCKSCAISPNPLRTRNLNKS
jgi:hypothetical protein